MRKFFTWGIILTALLWPAVVKQRTEKWPVPKGSMDFTGGIRLVYEMDASDQIAKGITNNSLRQQALQSAKNTFLFRLREFDLNELKVRTVGDEGLVVEIPGTEEIQNVLDRIGHAQVISFHIIDEKNIFEPTLPQSCFHFPSKSFCVGFVQVPQETEITHEDLEYSDIHAESNPSPDNPSDRYLVVLRFKQSAQQRVENFFRTYYMKHLAICLDYEIVSAPQIASQDIKTDAVITGFSTFTEADDIAKLLGAGPLPVSFNLAEQNVISPTLGARNFHSALVILPFALIAITLFLFLAYSNQPELATMILLCQALQASAIYFMSWQGYITLNMLSACALGILSGVSVDNLILIFEEFGRLLREEKVGYDARKIFKYMEVALKRETPIIARANLLSLATVFPLYFLEGPVRSLVITMVVGTALAFVTTLIIGRRVLKSDWVIGGLTNASRPLRPILGLRFNLFAMSKLFLVVYLSALSISVWVLVTKGCVVDIDLKSGVEMVLTSDVGIDTEVLEDTANAYFGRRCTVRHLSASALQTGAALTYSVQVPGLQYALGGTESSNASVGSRMPDQTAPFVGDRSGPSPSGLVQRLQETLAHPVQLASVTAVGATVTGITKEALIVAVAVGLLGLLIALFIRYDFKTSLSILVALLCDTTITVGAISCFDVPLSLPILSALLTVAGYSVYDSIVVAGHIHGDATRNGFLTMDQFNGSLENLSRRMILTVAATTVGAISVAIYCEGLLRDFGIVMTSGALFGMMSTASIVVIALRFALVRKPPQAAVSLTPAADVT